MAEVMEQRKSYRDSATAALQRRADILGRYYGMRFEIRRRGDSDAYRTFIEGVPTEASWRTYSVMAGRLDFAIGVASASHAHRTGQQMAEERRSA